MGVINKMKKIRISFLTIIIILSFSMVACSNKGESSKKDINTKKEVASSNEVKLKSEESDKSSISEKDINSAKEVIELNFKAVKERNWSLINKTQAAANKYIHGKEQEPNPEMEKELKNIYKTLDVLKIKLEENPERTCTSTPNNTKFSKENVITFEVTYKLETTKENVLTEPDGVHTKWCTLVRENKNSEWSILNLGY